MAVLTATGEALLHAAPDDDPRGHGDVWVALVDGTRGFFVESARPYEGV